MPFRAYTALLVLVAALALPAAAEAAGRPNVAALQVTLQARGLYGGTIDGIKGPRTTSAVRRFQQRRGLLVDGIVGPQTRRALGRYGRFRVGRRVMTDGMHGWDVAALQFMLAWQGFPFGAIDGHFGTRTGAALFRFQRWRRIGADGVAGPVTMRALRRKRPRTRLGFRRPVQAPIGDLFGPRGNRFHTGLDFTAWYGEPVFAARPGRVRGAGWTAGGYGNLVVLRHSRGTRSYYAHLSRVHVRVGQRVRRGTRIGTVGATGTATGPHLHFEIRVRGAAVNPLPALR
ncbi:MAG: peptidoglycan DD-metalloendopeptidase family protein [Candidatus Limnocylindria bacterium]